MAKYEFKDKCNVISAYFTDHKNYHEIARDTGIDRMEIKQWIQLYRIHGTEALKTRYHFSYSLSFKVKVIRYYLNHNEGARPVSARFNVNSSRLCKWVKILNSVGIKGLVPYQEKRKILRNQHQKRNLSSKDKRIQELEKQVHRYKLDYLALKYLARRK